MSGRALSLLGALALTTLLLCASTTRALAHGVLERSSIPPGALLPALPATLTLTFSESLATSLSSVAIAAPDGGTASSGEARAQDDRSLIADLIPRGGGTYLVSWSAVSRIDGQVTTGAFRFAVAYPTRAGDLSSTPTPRQATTLGIVGLLATLTRWLALLAALLWAGGALFEAPPGATLGRGAVSSGEAWIALLAQRATAVRRRTLEILLGLLAFGWLLQAAQLSTAGRVSLLGGLGSLIEGQLGFYRLLQLVMALLALVGLASASTAPPTPRGPAVGRWGRLRAALPPLGRWSHLALAALFLLAVAAGSHAAGVPRITLSAVLLEWLHDLASAAWLGGLGYLALVASPMLRNLDLDRRAPLTLGLLRRFIPLATAGILILAITGLFAAQVQVESRERLTGTPYGAALALKLALVALATGITWYLLDVQRGRIERRWSSRQRLESLAALERAERLLRASLLLGVLVVGSSAALWSNPPGAAPRLTAAAPLPALPSGRWQAAGLRSQAVYRVAFDPTNRHTLWAATDRGIWRSIDDQRSWSSRGEALARIPIYSLLLLDARTLLAAAANGKLYRSGDGGTRWQRLDRPFGTRPMRALVVAGGIILAGGDDGLFRSVDGGKRWRLVFNPPGQGTGSLRWSSAEGRFYAGSQRGPWQIFSSGADGVRWEALPGAPGSRSGVSALAALPDPTGRSLAGTGGDGLWVAPRPSGPWSQVLSSPGKGSRVDALLADPRTPGRLYAGTADAGGYGSTDGGTSWSPLGQDAPSTILGLAMRPGNVRILYAGTAQGIYKLTIGP